MKLIVEILVVLFIIVSTSCRNLVTDEFPEFIKVPTINSILTVDSVIKVQVSMAGQLDTNKLDLIDDAEVILYITGVYKETLITSGEGIYISKTVVEPGKKYECVVNIPGFSPLKCSDSLPIPMQLSDIVYLNYAGKSNEGIPYPAVRFTFTNIPNEEKYFEVAVRTIKSGKETSPEIIPITDPVLLSEGLPIAVFSNKHILSDTYTMTINYATDYGYSSLSSGVVISLYPVVIELRSISYEYYQFVRQLYIYEEGRYPEFLAGSISACPLYSNIIGGYGIFAGYSSIKSDTIYPH